MSFLELNTMLSHYIMTIYNNEQEFISEFFPELEGKGFELEEVYFAGYRVRLKLNLIFDDTSIVTTKPTNLLCEWVDDLVSKKLH